MSEIKTKGAIGRLYKQPRLDSTGKPMLDADGEVIKDVRIYFTQNAAIVQGQVAFLDDIVEDYTALEDRNALGGKTAQELLDGIYAGDKENNRTTLFRVKLGKVPVPKEASGNGSSL